MKKPRTKRCEKCGKLSPLNHFGLVYNAKKIKDPEERRFDVCKACYFESKEYKEKLSGSKSLRRKANAKKKEALVYLKKNASKLRKAPTKSEQAMYDELKNHGLVFIPQYPIGDSSHRYIVDTFIPTRHGNAGVVLEIDGEYHFDDEQIEMDANRDDYFHMRGFVVIRITNDQVKDRIDDVINMIKEYDPKKLSDVSITKRSKNGRKAIRL